MRKLQCYVRRTFTLGFKFVKIFNAVEKNFDWTTKTVLAEW